MVIFFLQLLPKLVDELVLGSDDQFEGFFLFVDSLRKRFAFLIFLQFRPLDLKSSVLFVGRDCLLLDSDQSFLSTPLIEDT